MAKLMVEHGGKVNVEDESGWTPLLLAINSGYAELVKFLIEKGAKIDVKAKDGAEVMRPFPLDCAPGPSELGRVWIQYGCTASPKYLGLIDATDVANIAVENATDADKQQAFASIIDLLKTKIAKANWLDKYNNLEGKSKKELRLLRNEIFARHGCGFKSKDLKKYFTSQDWYKYNSACSTKDLTQVEKDYLSLILKLEGKDSALAVGD